MSHSSNKKSVFDRIEGTMPSSNASSTVTISKNSHSQSKSGTHSFAENNESELGRTSGSKEDLRITKTVTRSVDVNRKIIKSTVSLSNDQRPVIVSATNQSSRTVIESHSSSNDHSDRRRTSTDSKQSKSRQSDSKTKSSTTTSDSSKSTKKKKSSHDRHYSSSKHDSTVSSGSDSERVHSSTKRKKKSEHSSSSRHKKQKSKSPTHDESELNTEQIIVQTKSPKRTIVVSRSDEKSAQRTKLEPEIEFLGAKKVHREKHTNETIHQQAENNKKSSDVKREKRSPNRSTNQEPSRSSTAAIASSISVNNEKSVTSKLDESKGSSMKAQVTAERTDRISSGSTPQIVHLSPITTIPSASETTEKMITPTMNDDMKSNTNLSNSPAYVILDDDSNPSTPMADEKLQRATSIKKIKESSTITPTVDKRVRESESSSKKDKISGESREKKSSRTADETSKKTRSSSKSTSENRSSSKQSDTRRSGTTSSKDGSSARKYKEDSSRKDEFRDRFSTKSSSKQGTHADRQRSSRNTPERNRSSKRRSGTGKSGHSDSDGHLDELTVHKPTNVEIYMAMDWSALSRDRRIPSNHQVTSRLTRSHTNSRDTLQCIGISERLLTDEQKQKLDRQYIHSSPLIHNMRQLQSHSTKTILSSCHRRFGSCAKDMLDMRHKWFIESNEPIQQLEFLGEDHYLTFQQATNTLLDRNGSDMTPTTMLPIETKTADELMMS